MTQPPYDKYPYSSSDDNNPYGGSDPYWPAESEHEWASHHYDPNADPRHESELIDDHIVDPRVGYVPFPLPQESTTAPPRDYRLLIGTVIVVLLLGIAGLVIFGGGDDAAPVANAAVPDPDARLSVLTYTVEGILPADGVGEVHNTAVSGLYAGLTKTDPETGKPQMLLADSITSNEAQTHWTVTLKPDLTFHDDTPLTAQSVVDSWDFAVAGSHEFDAAFLFHRIEGFNEAQQKDHALKGLKVVDDLTFTVAFNEPWSSFTTALATPAFAPIAESCVRDIEVCDSAPIAAGPFAIDGHWDQDPTMSLSRWDGYVGDKPAYAGIDLRFYDSSTLLMQDYINGSGDIARISADHVGNIDDSLVSAFPTSRFSYIGVPLNKPGYRDPDFRQALSLAIDRESILEKIHARHLVPANSFVAPGIPGYIEDQCVNCTHNPETAKELFDKSKWPKDKPMTIYEPGTDATTTAYATGVCEAVSTTFDIDCTVETSEMTDINKAIADGDIDGMWAKTWLPEYGAADAYLQPLYGVNNPSGYKNQTFQNKLTECASAPFEDAISCFGDAGQLLNNDMPLIPFATGVYQLGHRERINSDGLYVDPTTQSPQYDSIVIMTKP